MSDISVTVVGVTNVTASVANNNAVNVAAGSTSGTVLVSSGPGFGSGGATALLVEAGANITVTTSQGSFVISGQNIPVTSVNGKTGAVTLTTADIGGLTNVGNVVSVSGKTGAVTLVPTDVSGLTSVANVASVNGITGSPTIVGGQNVTVSTSASSITIAASGNVLSVNGRTGAVVLASTDVSAASSSHSHVAANITNLTAVANVVSVNGITGTPAIVGGQNVTVSTSASSITIAASGNVLSVNGRTGSVVLSATDVTAASATHGHSYVTSLNSNTGSLSIVAGSNVTVTTSASSITVSSGLPSHTHVVGDVSGLQAALDSKQPAGTYATLVNGTVPASQLPAYIDDIVDAGGSLPTTGEVGKLYVITSGTNINKVYRWSGSVWVEIVASPGTTDSLVEGAVNLYFTNARALAAVQPQLDAKASLNHQHQISQVVGLQTALDSKAALSHVHVVGEITGLQNALNAKAALSHTHAVSDISNLQASLDAKAALAHQHAIADVPGLQAAIDSRQPAGNYATLVGGKVPAAQLPSYIDDVMDVGSTLPAAGDVGILYVISSGVNANKVYRWSGSTFIEIVASPGTTDALPEGSLNLYFTSARAIAAVQSLLNGKASLVHTHVIADITGLQSSLSSLQTSVDAKAPLSHSHVVSDVVGLQSALNSKASIVHTHAISEVVGLTAALDGKAALSHTHAISEVVGLSSALNAKADLFHTHVIADVNGLQNSLNSLQSAINGKAPLSHTHAIADVTNLESRLQFASTLTTPPASDTASGAAGQLALDATYLYGCVATNTWKRIPWEAYGSGAAGITITAQPTNQTAGTSSGTVTMTSSSETIPGTFSYDGSAITTLKLNAAFYNNGTVQYATSSDYTNVLFVRQSGSWSGSLVHGSSPVKAATSHGQRDYNSTNNPTIPHPYRYIAGNNSFTVLAKEEQNYQDVFNAAVIQPLALSTTDVASGSPAFTASQLGSLYTAGDFSIQGVCGLAASSSMVVAALVRGNWSGDSYGYTAPSLTLKRAWSYQPLAYTVDGTNWNDISVAQRAGVYDITYNSGRFIAIGAVEGGSPRAWHSSNGLSWTAVSLPTGTYVSIAAGGGKLVAVGYPANRQYFAENWVGPFLRSANSGVVIDDGSLSQRVLVSSDNGTTWTSVEGLPILETWIKVAFVPGIAAFVAFAVGNQVAAVSADGVNWDPVFRGTSSSVYGCHAIIDGDLYQPSGGYFFGKDAFKMTFTSTGGTGGTATFSVTATAATAISYQWQVSTDFGTSFTNISGATSATLSLTGLTAGDNGKRYRCRLTSGSTTVLSSVAILTVTS